LLGADEAFLRALHLVVDAAVRGHVGLVHDGVAVDAADLPDAAGAAPRRVHPPLEDHQRDERQRREQHDGLRRFPHLTHHKTASPAARNGMERALRKGGSITGRSPRLNGNAPSRGERFHAGYERGRVPVPCGGRGRVSLTPFPADPYLPGRLAARHRRRCARPDVSPVASGVPLTESVAEEIRTLESLVWSERDPEGRGFAALADAFRRAEQPRRAFEILNEGLTRLPAFTPGHVVAACLYVEQGPHQEGEIAARRPLELDPDNVRALAWLARALQGVGKTEEAERTLATLQELEPEVLAEEGLAEGEASLADTTEAAAAPAFDGSALEGLEGVELAEPPEPIAEPADLAPDEPILEAAALAPDEPTLDVGDLAPGEPVYDA